MFSSEITLPGHCFILGCSSNYESNEKNVTGFHRAAAVKMKQKCLRFMLRLYYTVIN